ncbi:MAG: hypothetical protein CMJ06_02445 [Pelagibacterales bacterium]|nr:hypothetical protein [Pelagibacterales bacterium]OUU62916.1 MAG: hypothetical protein CBC22_02425 [Alphaproteobacteria bacterium TMED62]
MNICKTKIEMKNIFIQLYSIIVFTFLFSINSNAMIFECENGFTYKIENYKNQLFIYYKELNKDWKAIVNSNISENKYELILPNSQYLGCANKNLAICNYNTLITYKPSTGEANVREVIRNDCYIGTMGCNKYEKGLELNLRRCNVINNISTSN